MKHKISKTQPGISTAAVRLMVICGLVVGMSLLYSVYRIKAANTQLHDLTRTNFLLTDCRRHEEDFLRTNRIWYLDKFEETAAQLDVAVRELSDSKFLPVADLNDLAVLIDTYKGVFHGVARARMYIGLDPQSGLRGDLERLAGDVDRVLVAYDLQAQRDLLKTCRRSEENFLQRKDPVYAREFEAAFTALRRELDPLRLPAEEKLRLSGSLAVWRGTDKLFFDAVSEIGLDDDDGMLKTLAGARSELGRRIEQFEGIINANYTRPTLVIYSTSLLLVVLMLVGAVLVREMVGSNRSLRAEIAQRLALEQELITHKDNMSQLVSERTRELAAASREIRQLRGLLPVCSECGELRDDPEYRQELAGYLKAHPGLDATARPCAECVETCPTLA